MKFAVLAIACTLVVAEFANAAVILDQQHLFSSSIADSSNGNVSEVGQTFTVGVAGTLDHIDVLMFQLGSIFTPTGDPKLSVYATAGGVPTGAPLVTMSVPQANVPLNNPGLVTFDVSAAAIPVSIGEVLAFGISTTSEIGPYFLPNDDDTGAPGDYTAGAAFRRTISPVQAWQPLTPAVDHGFQTFVSATVPEPSTFALAGFALVGLGIIARRNQDRRGRH